LKQKKHRGNIVTLKGELFSARGRITGGEASKSGTSVILERKKEIKQLEEAIKINSKKLKEIDSSHEKLMEEMALYEAKLENIDDLREENVVKLRNIEKKYYELEDRLKRLKKERAIVEVEIQEEDSYNLEYNKQISSKSVEKVDVEKFMESLRENLESKKRELTKEKVALENLNRDFSDIKINYLNKKEVVKQLLNEIMKNEDELKEIIFEKKEIDNRNEFLKEELKTLEERLLRLEDDYLKDETKYKNEFEEIKTNKELYKQLEVEEKNFIKAVNDCEKEIIELNNKKSRKLEKKEKLGEDLRVVVRKLEDLKEVEIINFSGDIAREKRNLSSYEGKLKSLGIVNLLSIEEFKEVKEKFEYIVKQRDDLTESRKSLNKLIADIEKVIEMKFYKAFTSISKNFNYMCKEVLNNSVGRLRLVDSEKLLDSGVEILVKFKNKKTQPITLLSGGEKSMVAVAFIMSIFMYKPSPFTFFDEIEAALDETNTKRLINKLKEFTDKSQFILITHNKETMRNSDRLFGVTMNKELGESRLIAVNM